MLPSKTKTYVKTVCNQKRKAKGPKTQAPSFAFGILLSGCTSGLVKISFKI
jgi:hypothetical protein